MPDSSTIIYPPPSQPAFCRALRDFDHLASFFSGWRGRFEQLTAGAFEGTLLQAKGRSVRVVSVELNQSILARGKGASGLFTLYTVTPENSGGIWQGRRLDPGQFVVHGPEAETDHLTARQCTSVGLSVAVAEMDRAVRSLTGGDIRTWPQSWDARVPSPESYLRVVRRMKQFLATTVADPAVLVTREGYHLEQECLRAVVAGMESGTNRDRDWLSLPARANLIRRAEALMRAHVAEPWGAVDVCEYLGVSDRTLRLAFRERFGIGPMTYYRAVRLNAVRETLKSVESSAVSDTARRHGFHHLGNFAADYRRLFGERPSETRQSVHLASRSGPRAISSVTSHRTKKGSPSQRTALPSDD